MSRVYHMQAGSAAALRLDTRLTEFDDLRCAAMVRLAKVTVLRLSRSIAEHLVNSEALADQSLVADVVRVYTRN